MSHRSEATLASRLGTEGVNYRAVVLRDGGKELLVELADYRVRLPSIEVPRQQRVAQNLTEALRRDLGCEVICLFAPEIHSTETSEIHAQVMEFQPSSRADKRQLVWLPVSSFSHSSFQDANDHLVLCQSLRELSQAPQDCSEPFRTLGWFQELRTWAVAMIAPLGLRLTEEFRQFNASPSFSLIRFETTSSPVWFKAVGLPNEHEFPITLTLARHFPQHVPALIAFHPEWRGWLMHDGGTAMSTTTPGVEDWQQVVNHLAGFQLDSIVHSEELLKAGSRDLRIPRLLDLVDPFLERMRVLMQEQETASPAPLTAEELAELGIVLKDALAVLEQVGIPVTLGHSDFNPGNILSNDSHFLFIDWAEAYVGHPFFTFEYLLSHLRRDWPEAATFESFIRSAYARPWKYVVPAQSIAEAFILSPLVAVFAYAAACQPRTTDPDERTAGYLRSLTRRMRREADLLGTKRVPCLQC
jgi:hypothetical protein